MKLLIFIFSINLLFSRNVVVLLGDFKTKDGSYMSKISTMLKNRGFEVIDTLKVNTNLPIDCIHEPLMEKLLDKENLNKDDNIILIGHGQGGIASIKVCWHFKLAKLNLKAIFTTSTPWRGASILNSKVEILNNIIDILNNIEKCSEYINFIGNFINLKKNKIAEYLLAAKHLKTSMQDSLDCLGIEQMMIKDKTIKGLNDYINIRVPIFNIISYYDRCNPNMKKINKYKEQITELAEYAKKLSVINNVLLMENNLKNNEMTTDATKQVIYASKLVNNLISLLNELIEFNKEDNNRILTVKEQQLPTNLNQAQCKLRNKEGTLGYMVKGIHRSVTDNHEGTVYDNDEVVNYISRSIDNNFNPVLKDEDVR